MDDHGCNNNNINNNNDDDDDDNHDDDNNSCTDDCRGQDQAKAMSVVPTGGGGVGLPGSLCLVPVADQHGGRHDLHDP